MILEAKTTARIVLAAALVFTFDGTAAFSKSGGNGKSSASSGKSSGGGGKSSGAASASSSDAGSTSAGVSGNGQSAAGVSRSKTATAGIGGGKSNGKSHNHSESDGNSDASPSGYSASDSEKAGRNASAGAKSGSKSGTEPKDDYAAKLARDYRAITTALGPKEQRLAALEQEIAALQVTRHDADIERDIKALDRAAPDYRKKLRALTSEKLRSPSRDLVHRKIGNRKKSAVILKSEISRLEAARAGAWVKLTDGRSPKEAAVEVLKEKYGIK